MRICEFCGKEAEYKVTTSLKPDAVSYVCKACLENKKKEMSDAFPSIMKETFPLAAALPGINNIYKRTLSQLMKVRRINK
jgi:ribosome-binding protein aMBF1 (putative translation factor)